MRSHPRLSLVVPAHNEEDVIAATLDRVAAETERLGVATELIVGDSACTDGTVERALAWAAQTGRSQALTIVRCERPGKGRVLTAALGTTRGGIVGFVDADLEIDVGYLEPLYWEMLQGADAAIASKQEEGSGSPARRPWRRRALSKGWNALVRAAFRTPFRDHQAGFKLFRGPHLRALLPGIRGGGWTWDTEVLVGLYRNGAVIREVPVQLSARRPSRLVPGAAWLGAGTELAALYLRRHDRLPAFAADTPPVATRAS